MTAQAWLVLTLTHSSTALGVIVALQTLPVLLLAPYGGVIADRVDKRRLMIALQTAMGVQALILGLLTVTGSVRVWEIGVLAVLLGLNNAFENPARQSFMLEMVGPDHLRNAVSLNSVLVNVARVARPGGRRDPDRDRRRRRLLPGQRGELRRGRRVADRRWTRAALRPTEPTPRAKGQLREGLRVRPRHARARDPAADDGRRRLPHVRVPGLAAGDGEPRPARRRRRLRLHDRGDGRRRRGRRAARGGARARPGCGRWCSPRPRSASR